jgi:hypothetical protein
LDLVHLDVCGPMPVAYLGGFMYYAIFIYDFSRKTWIFFKKRKDEVFSRFHEFRSQVENLTWNKIKVLRSNNGGEYTSKEFNDLCKEARIKRELTVPYNPQQNNIAERKNRSIVEDSKAMIHDKDLPMFLWGEESNTTMYVHNRSPHWILGDKTPEESFTSVKLEVIHLRIFGYPVYIHMPKEKKMKLEPSRKKGMFFGYNETSKDYRIYILGQF